MVARLKKTASGKQPLKRQLIVRIVAGSSYGGGVAHSNEEEREAQMHLLQTMVDDMVKDPGHILPMYTHLEARKAAAAAAFVNAFAKDAPSFGKLTTFNSADTDFRGSWVTANSDLSAADIVAAVRKDPEAIDQLVTFATQVVAKQKVPMELHTIAVMTTFMNRRSEAAGKRLTDFKNKGGIAYDGSLNWIHGSYTLVFDDTDRLTTIRHISGVAVQVDPNLGITKAWHMMSNYNDFEAAVRMLPMPPVRLCTFFPDGIGPNSLTNFVGKPKVLQKIAAECYQDWELQQRAEQARSKPSDAVKSVLDDHRKAQAATAMEKARTAAKKALQEKRDRNTIKLKD